MKRQLMTQFKNIHTFLRYCLERNTVSRSITTALVVGTLLTIINHGQEILARQISVCLIIPILVTYLVPFSVATYTQVTVKRQHNRVRIMTKPLES